MPSRSWRHTLARLAMIYVLVVPAATLAGQPMAGIAIASTMVAAWCLVRLAWVIDLLHHRRRFTPPTEWGAWAELEALLYQRQRENRDRKQRLIRMLREYREAAAVLPDAVVVLDRGSLRILWVNEAAGMLVGLHHPRDVGTLFIDRVRTPRVVDWIRLERSDEPLIDVPSPIDPSVRLSFRRIRYTDGQWLVVVRDISKLMHLEQVRRDFVANVSHELRTPLTVVHGYLDLVEPAEKPEWAPMLEEMRRQSQRMTQIVEDLLTLSHLEAQERLPEEAVDMGAMLITLRREAEALSQGQHRVRVAIRTDADILGSLKELHSAFSNLVANAVRYTPAGGSIDIEYHEGDDGGPVFAVRDTGQGIPPQHLPRITERFYRVSTSRSRGSGGTGLGLSIVKHVLALHQAQMQIESEVGVGSTFRVEFGPERKLRNDRRETNLA